ncbi:MAG TPA: chloramphenicol acetyltransferase [Microscillaceae bacterium]|nr:chloramphenicol acetyltransferase [Microscillaceae bacterium]
MLICFEGPSAVGKTTLSQSLSTDFQVIPEANQLFIRPENEPRLWYYHKQVERYQMGVQAKRPVILDGDIFQPLWYNWTYDYPETFPSQKETHQFFQDNIAQEKMAFPDLYIIFKATHEQLRQRKQKDPTRTRRHFEKHLQLIESQQRYFQYLKSIGMAVAFVEYNDFDITRNQVLSIIAAHKVAPRSHTEDFQKIIGWLTKN